MLWAYCLDLWAQLLCFALLGLLVGWLWFCNGLLLSLVLLLPSDHAERLEHKIQLSYIYKQTASLHALCACSHMPAIEGEWKWYYLISLLLCVCFFLIIFWRICLCFYLLGRGMGSASAKSLWYFYFYFFNFLGFFFFSSSSNFLTRALHCCALLVMIWSNWWREVKIDFVKIKFHFNENIEWHCMHFDLN